MSSSKVKTFLFVFLTFINISTSFFWYDNVYFILLPTILLYIVYLENIALLSFKLKSLTIFLFLIQIVYFCIIKDTIIFEFFNTFNILFLSIILYNESDIEKISIFNFFFKVFVILQFVSIITYILSYVISLPYLAYGGDKFFFLFVTPEEVTSITNFYRFQSIFSEPGILGTVCFFVLFYKRFQFKEKGDFVILLSGILSFSLYFYLATIISIIMFKIKSKKEFLFFLISLLIIYIVIKDVKVFQEYFFNRLEITENTISGDNRTSIVWTNNYNEFISSNDYFMGRGTGSIDRNTFGYRVASYQIFIYEFGIIGAILIFLYFYVLTRNHLDLFNTALILISIGSFFYTRPYVLTYFFLFLFISGLSAYKNRTVSI